MANNTDTPMMKQFRDIKAQYPDAMLLFRCGDFYETYAEDAVRAAQVLEITLTHRNNGGAGGDIEMAGFPFHALDTYLPRLVRQGIRVAICDQLEDPKLTKKLVKRGVTELVTPAVSYSDTTLEGKENSWLACVHFAKNVIGVAFLDISTGEFLLAQGQADYIERLLSNFRPKELLHLRGTKPQLEATFSARYFTFELEDWMLTRSAAEDRLKKQFSTQNLKGFGIEHLNEAIIAAGGILHYLDMTQHLQTGHIRSLSRIEEDRYVWLDRFTMRNLELFSTPHEEGKTLLDIMDRTVSPMGGRMLRRWITLPLKDVSAICRRQSVVQYMCTHSEVRDAIRLSLSHMQDIERIVSKIATGRISPREMNILASALCSMEEIRSLLAQASDTPYLVAMSEQIHPCPEVHERIHQTIVPDPPAVSGRPGVIASGVDNELDELRLIQTSGRDYLLRLQQREAEQTGIQSLKIGFNNVFGYYLEVRNTYRDQVPDTWIRKQTLVNAERYITDELKEYENRILNAENDIAVIETRLYNELILSMAEYVADMQTDANIMAQLDCLITFAVLAEQNHYVCPTMDESLRIDICQGRHPVIEQQLPFGEQYVANDLMLDNDSQQIIILSGPNMSGKSALLRQTALIVLMAQVGSFVPAKSACIGVVDKIFTRVGASDNLSLGESTFMVEMNEAASILNNLSERSLVLFDELGRGTSTYDGISIAWAIVEYIHENRHHAKTLFATHYHELNEMEHTYERIRNYNVSVREVDGKVIFLRKLARGGSAHSFGINVAKLAGMPPSIIAHANDILHSLERQAASVSDTQNGGQPQTDPVAKVLPSAHEGMQLSFFQLDDPVLEQIRDQLTHLDINNLTPLEALNKLSEIRNLVGGH